MAPESSLGFWSSYHKKCLVHLYLKEVKILRRMVQKLNVELSKCQSNNDPDLEEMLDGETPPR